MQQFGRDPSEPKMMPLQQYAYDQGEGIRRKYGQKISEVRKGPDEAIWKIQHRKYMQDDVFFGGLISGICAVVLLVTFISTFIVLVKKDLTVAQALTSLFGTTFGVTFAVGLVSVTFLKSIKKGAEKRIKTLQEQRDSRIQALDAQQQQELKQLYNDLNNKINQQCGAFLQNQLFTYPVEWLIHVLSDEISRADRSKWNPQVKASLTFTVTNKTVEVANYGKYDMAAQGIFVDPNPLAVTALAHVLEQMTMKEAKYRFQKDPSGGRPVFTSRRNDYEIVISYSAPNGGAAAK